MAEDAARELATTRHGHAATIGAEPHGKLKIFVRQDTVLPHMRKISPYMGFVLAARLYKVSVYTPHGTSILILV